MTNLPWLSSTENSDSLPLSLLVPIHSVYVLPLLLSLSASLGILLTYIAEGWTSTNSKHISRDPYPLLLCDVTGPTQADGHAGNMSHVGHLLLMCDITAPVPACSTVACVFCVYRAAACQCVDQICRNTYRNTCIHIQIYRQTA
jgi:hypothetical protein